MQGKIDNLSSYAVDEYIGKNIPLDNTIARIAMKEGYGKHHIARIVEASNKKTFLRLFPERHEFDVASVEGVTNLLGEEKDKGMKSANEARAVLPFHNGAELINYNLLHNTNEDISSCEKAASVQSTGRSQNKVASLYTLMLLRDNIKSAMEELEYEARCKRASLLEAEQELIKLTKQAILRGTPFCRLEEYVLSIQDDDSATKQAAEVLDGIYNRIKNIPFIEKSALNRGKRNERFVGRSNLYTTLVERMVKIAHEELPRIENTLQLLKRKSDQIEQALRR